MKNSLMSKLSGAIESFELGEDTTMHVLITKGPGALLSWYLCSNHTLLFSAR
jgi:hypothetical protein